MDSRPEPTQDEEATPEHDAKRVGTPGFTYAQPDRSGAGENSDGSTWPDRHPAPGQGDVQRLEVAVFEVWKAKARSFLRRHPIEADLSAIGVILLGNVLGKHKHGR